ncbi:hypothetical protein F5I97DRAFT_470102 [Phlebopus sp. FC_14]|nr:hypothetical protein F5I97DRAFT_470102 [Phlebopus sp. FC_14]
MRIFVDLFVFANYSDQWTVVNMGLSDLQSPVTSEMPERSAHAEYAISTSPIVVTPISESPPPFLSPQSVKSFPYPPPGIEMPPKSKRKHYHHHHHHRDPEWQEHDPDLDAFESNFPNFPTPSYEKSIHVDNTRSKSHKRFGRVKHLVRRMLSSSGNGNGGVRRSATTTNGRHQYSDLVRTPSPRGGGSRASWTAGGWSFASMGGTPVSPFNERWSGLWH